MSNNLLRVEDCNADYDSNESHIDVHPRHMFETFTSKGDVSAEIAKRVYLIETHSGLRARIARAIFAHGFHTEIFSSIAEFLAFNATEAGVLVVNQNLDDADGVGTVKRLSEARHGLPIIIYAENATIEQAIAVIRAGADNYLSLAQLDTQLRGAIESASPSLVATYSQQNRMNDLKRRMQGLSRRESEVLGYLASGYANKEIAKILNISPRTVEIHRMKMMNKISARTSADAVRIWCSCATGTDIRPIEARKA